MSKSAAFLCKKKAALQWIENVLDIKIDQNQDFAQILDDGVLLCKVMHTISPRLMPRISNPDTANTPKATIRFKYNENISFFIQACADMGVPRHKRFALLDIVNNQISYSNIRRVIECLESVCKIANSDSNYDFSVEWPQINPEEEKFSSNQIDHAEQLLAQFTIRENKRQEVIKKSQTQNEGNSVEETKNQLFKHIAAQKQLYPDNSPVLRVNNNLNSNNNNSSGISNNNNNNSKNNSTLSSPSSSYSSLSSSPLFSTSSISTNSMDDFIKDEAISSVSNNNNSNSNSNSSNSINNSTGSLSDSCNSTGSIRYNKSDLGVKSKNNVDSSNNNNNTSNSSNNSLGEFSFKDILKKWKEPSFFNSAKNNNNTNSSNNQNSSNNNNNGSRSKSNSVFISSNQGSSYNSPYCTIKFKPNKNNNPTTTITQQAQSPPKTFDQWKHSSTTHYDSANSNNLISRNRSVSSSAGSINNTSLNHYSSYGDISESLKDNRINSDNNNNDGNNTTKNDNNSNSNNNSNEINKKDEINKEEVVDRVEIKDDVDNSPKSDRNSLSQPVSPLITGNVKSTSAPDQVSLNNSPVTSPVVKSSDTASPTKPTIVSTATVTPSATPSATTTTTTTSTSSVNTTPVQLPTTTTTTNVTTPITTPTATKTAITKLSLEERAAIRIQRATRAWIERNRKKIQARDSAYRERIVQEIMKTEVEYINRLAFLNDHILKDLREAIEKGSPIISQEEIQSIFSEVSIILSYNKRLLIDLENRTKDWKVDTLIGDIFIKFSNFLKIYSQYSRSYSEAMGVLNECKKQTKFKSYLNKVKESNEEIKLRGLEDYLIRPIQRIPRYSLLIKDMIGHTWQTHPDYEQLKIAFEKINSVAENMNEMRKEAESIMKLAEIQEKLDGDQTQQLAKSHRRFVKEGEFHEVLPKGKKSLIVLYLFNDSLAITRPNKSSGSSFFGKQKTIRLQFEQIIFLHQLVLKEFEGSLNLQILKEKSFSMMITAPDKDTLNEWIKAINIEKVEYQKTLSDHNDRQMSHVVEKAEQTKQKIEEKFTRSSGQYNTKDVESLGSNENNASHGSSNSLSGSNGGNSSEELSNSLGDLKSGKMSLRERRVKLAQESKTKRLSGTSSSFTNLNDQNLKDSK
ncbi:hypothetical protein RB653_004764 [Dictyostelium firmibasis]|uniref:Uncharacterized protein n=1 Tax=Dictyostelium firmibasis TaxID=79012 RepID=A0AAN7UJX4_9MYCE